MTHVHAPRPLFITPRTPGAVTEGREIARLARLLGKPLMPWQRRVVDGLTEKTPDGLYRYSRALITVPRQSGKTTLVGPLQLHRIMTRKGVKAFFTAQDGATAHRRMLDLIKLATDSPVSSLFHPRYAAGSAGVTTPNGSQLRAFARAANLHGETPHLVTVDEIWSLDDVTGGDLMGAVGPAQATLEGEAQTVMISTKGTSGSTFMNDLVDLGRAGGAPGFFYAEWSLPPGHDPYEPQSWWTFHPALGNTITVSYLQSQADAARDPNDASLSHGEYMRGYMNVLTTALDPLIADEDFAELATEQHVPLRSEITVTYEVGLDNEAGAVMATWTDPDGHPCTRVLHRAPGTVWMEDYIVRIADEWKPAQIGADNGGATRGLTTRLRRRLDPPDTADADSRIRTLGGVEYGIACGDWITAARDDKTLVTDGSETLATEIRHAVMASRNGIRTFAREQSTGPIPAIIASAVGMYLHANQTVPLAKPRLSFGGSQ